MAIQFYMLFLFLLFKFISSFFGYSEVFWIVHDQRRRSPSQQIILVVKRNKTSHVFVRCEIISCMDRYACSYIIPLRRHLFLAHIQLNIYGIYFYNFDLTWTVNTREINRSNLYKNNIFFYLSVQVNTRQHIDCLDFST